MLTDRIQIHILYQFGNLSIIAPFANAILPPIVSLLWPGIKL